MLRESGLDLGETLGDQVGSAPVHMETSVVIEDE